MICLNSGGWTSMVGLLAPLMRLLPVEKKAHFNLPRTDQGQFRVLQSSNVVCLPSLRL
jgi:hypothetical protein